MDVGTRALEHPPVRPTDGFAFLLGYPTITAWVVAQWALADGGPSHLRYELELPVRVQVADESESTDGVTTNVSRGDPYRDARPAPRVGRDRYRRAAMARAARCRGAAGTAVGTVKRIRRQAETGGAVIGVAVERYHSVRR